MGPLSGLQVLEFEAVGPAPFCGMLLADLGADVLLVDRPAPPTLGFELPRRAELMLRGRRSVTLDLKAPAGVAAALELATRADAVIEGFRPGVLERMGLGPAVLLARNPRLVVGRMTGWGQNGPLAARAGHDIDFIALAGALHAIGPAGGRPVPPLNLVGDFGGGGLLLALGVVAALLESRSSGQGQVVDAAMIEGAGLLMTMFHGMASAGQWTGRRGDNVLDSGAPWYDTYETRDGGFLAVGAIEPKFYAELVARLGLDPAALPAQHDRARWPELRARLAAAIRARTRAEWEAVFAGSDACVAPVLSFAEAPRHPQHAARGSYVEVAGLVQPGPAPRFSRTPGEVRRAPPERGEGGLAALADWGFTPAEIALLQAEGLGGSE